MMISLDRLRHTAYDNERRIRQLLLRFTALTYTVLLVLVIVFFDSATLLSSISFLVINLIITVIFLNLCRFGTDNLICYLVYVVYFIVYIFKGIMIKVTGINTLYIYTTIRVIIETSDYVTALNMVTLGHVLLIVLLYLNSRLQGGHVVVLANNRYPKNETIIILLVVISIWITLSSVIMYKYGVAVMGGKGVSLPYKMSGILFYSRKLIIPLLLLFYFEKSLVKRNHILFYLILTVFLYLTISEIIVRASKGPLLIMTLYITVLFFMVQMRGIDCHQLVSRKLLVIFLAVAIFSFPIITAYRRFLLSVGSDISLTSLVASLQSNGSYIGNAIGHFFHRLIGFTQFVGIVALNPPTINLYDFFNSGGSIAKYYTEQVLGYHIVGHLSSPSLLGASYLVGGNYYWLLVFAIYISVLLIFWRYLSWFRSFEVAIKCMFCYEAFNSMMAGTVDSSIFRMTIVCAFALICNLLISLTQLARKYISI